MLTTNIQLRDLSRKEEALVFVKMEQMSEKPVYPPIKFLFCSFKFVNIKNIDHNQTY